LLARCVEDRRALLTNNVSDFSVLVRRWQVDGRGHYGLIFTADTSLPRTRHHIGRYVDLLAALMRLNRDVDDFVDRTRWL
jgi:hypothetical protein